MEACEESETNEDNFGGKKISKRNFLVTTD